jgi:hypothetical protein
MAAPDYRSGEAGQQGRDRQPNREPTKSKFSPDPGEIPSPAQVEQRSKEAAAKPGHDRPDLVHPGPGREDAEISKGNAHHKQHEPQPDMQKEVEDL